MYQLRLPPRWHVLCKSYVNETHKIDVEVCNIISVLVSIFKFESYKLQPSSQIILYVQFSEATKKLYCNF